MSQIYQAHRRAQDAPAEKYQTSVPGPSMREPAAEAVPSGGQMGGGVAPLSASAVPASAAGPIQAAKHTDEQEARAAETANKYGEGLPSKFWHPFKRSQAIDQWLNYEPAPIKAIDDYDDVY